MLILGLVDRHDFALLPNYYNGQVVGKLCTILKVPLPGGKTPR